MTSKAHSVSTRHRVEWTKLILKRHELARFDYRHIQAVPKFSDLAKIISLQHTIWRSLTPNAPELRTECSQRPLTMAHCHNATLEIEKLFFCRRNFFDFHFARFRGQLTDWNQIIGCTRPSLSSKLVKVDYRRVLFWEDSSRQTTSARAATLLPFQLVCLPVSKSVFSRLFYNFLHLLTSFLVHASLLDVYAA